MGKYLFMVLVSATFLGFMFPFLSRVTIPVMLGCMGLMCVDALWSLFKLIFFKGKFDGNQTRR